MSFRGANLNLNRGSDIRCDLNFKDDTGAAVDMTGWTIGFFEAEPWVLEHAVVEWTNQVAGEARFSAPWQSDAPAKTWVRVRVTRTADDFDDALPPITVRFV